MVWTFRCSNAFKNCKKIDSIAWNANCEIVRCIQTFDPGFIVSFTLPKSRDIITVVTSEKYRESRQVVKYALDPKEDIFANLVG
jgi:hypothetical protein